MKMKKILIFMMALALTVVFNATAAGVNGPGVFDTIQTMEAVTVESTIVDSQLLDVSLTVIYGGLVSLGTDNDKSQGSVFKEALTLRGTKPQLSNNLAERL